MTTKQEKARRMEIRKKTGSRVIVPPAKNEYRRGGYLVAHACFSCRTSFKIEPRDDLAPCPNCSSPLALMGRSFKAPKKSNIMQWRKVEKLWLAGIRFPTNSFKRFPWPKRWQDVDKLFDEVPKTIRWYHEVYRPRQLKLERKNEKSK